MDDKQAVWTSAAAEIALTLAAINSNALARAGLLEFKDADFMHALLPVLEGAAGSEAQKNIARNIRALLPLVPTPAP